MLNNLIVFCSFLTVAVQYKTCLEGNAYNHKSIIPRYINTCGDHNVNPYNIRKLTISRSATLAYCNQVWNSQTLPKSDPIILTSQGNKYSDGYCWFIFVQTLNM